MIKLIVNWSLMLIASIIIVGFSFNVIHAQERMTIEQARIFAEAGNENAMWFIAYMDLDLFQRGTSDINVEEGVVWLKILSARGNVDAKEILGDLYFFGRVVPQDYNQAFFWYNHYINFERDPDILTRLATLYAEGLGTDQDLIQAAGLLIEAVGKNYLPAILLMQKTYLQMSPLQRDLVGQRLSN